MARWSLETLYLPGFREFIRLSTVSKARDMLRSSASADLAFKNKTRGITAIPRCFSAAFARSDDPFADSERKALPDGLHEAGHFAAVKCD